MIEVIRQPVDAEIYAAGWMRALGFHDARETPPVGDAGIDVMASGAVAQVKFKTMQVGRPELQNFVGAAHTHPGKQRLFFSWKGYSSHAIEYAEQAQVALFSFELSGHYVPVNAYAHHLSAIAQGLPPTPVWQGATAAQAAARYWWTPRRIWQVVLGVVLFGVVIFFFAHPDAFFQVLGLTCLVAVMWIWLNASAPKKRRRSASRRRRH